MPGDARRELIPSRPQVQCPPILISLHAPPVHIHEAQEDGDTKQGTAFTHLSGQPHGQRYPAQWGNRTPHPPDHFRSRLRYHCATWASMMTKGRLLSICLFMSPLAHLFNHLPFPVYLCLDKATA